MAFIKIHQSKQTEAFTRAIALIGWTKESFAEEFRANMIVSVDAALNALKIIPVKPSKATAEFQREFVIAAKFAGFSKVNYTANTGVYLYYKK